MKNQLQSPAEWPQLQTQPSTHLAATNPN